MRTASGFARTRQVGAWGALGAALSIALWAGCQGTSKQDHAARTQAADQPPPAEVVQAPAEVAPAPAQPAAPAQAAAPARPAEAEDDVRVGEPVVAAPVRHEHAAAGQSTPPSAASAAPAGQSAEMEALKKDGEQQKALAELIRQRVLEGRKAREAEQARQPAAPEGKPTVAARADAEPLLRGDMPTVRAQPVTPARAQAEGPAQPGPAQPPAGAKTEEQAKAGGCGPASTLDLTPPPPDAPQPKFACAQPVATLESLWKGQPANFEFEIRNAGQGPLKIEVKGG